MARVLHLLFAIVLVFLGPKRLPALGRSLGSGVRTFKDTIRNRHERDELPPAVSEESEPLTGEVVRDRRPTSQ